MKNKQFIVLENTVTKRFLLEVKINEVHSEFYHFDRYDLIPFKGISLYSNNNRVVSFFLFNKDKLRILKGL